MNELRVHVFETGRLTSNATFMRGEGWASLLRRRRDYEFPANCFVIERPDGLIAIDTGLSRRARSPRPWAQRRFVPNPRPGQEIGPAMRAAGLDPADVRTVVLTHLDWDHAGGLAHFPQAEVLVHRPESEFAATFMGRQRFEPGLWPRDFRPTLYELEEEPYGPFPQSLALTDDGTLRLVPMPGHSPGQVGVVARSNGTRVLFAADHVLRQDWFLADYAAGRHVGLGVFFPKQARETSRHLHEFIESVPTVLVPSHDADAPERIAAVEVADVA